MLCLDAYKVQELKWNYICSIFWAAKQVIFEPWKNEEMLKWTNWNAWREYTLPLIFVLLVKGKMISVLNLVLLKLKTIFQFYMYK